jgi:TonB-linked SusC/RagA family outer membrane protein
MRYKILLNFLLCVPISALLIFPSEGANSSELSASTLIFYQTSQSTVKGKVTNNLGEALPGVNVFDKANLSNGTVTNEKGEYSITIPQNATLVFTFIGFIKEEIEINNKTVIDMSLMPDISALQEVVVVGYGEQKKVSVTGSVATVNMADMKTPIRSLSNALAGRVAGVISMQSGGGEPGYDNPNFTIRGIGTFTGSTSPLIIVDGVQREDVNSTYGGAFNNIDPEDVASISLLKDASATAVYGAKGANGVLIITTKRGVAGKPKVSVKIESGITGLNKTPKMLDGVNYMKLYNEAQMNDPSYTGTGTYTDEWIAKTQSGLDPYLYPNVNWIKTIYKDWASMVNANVNVSGGSEAVKYYVSMSFYDQAGQYKVSEINGYNPNLSFKRYDFRNNIDANITKTTTLSLNIAAMLVNSRYPGNTASNIWYSSYATNPISFPVSYPDHKWAGPRNNGGVNPYNLVQNSGYSTEFKPSVQSVLSLTQKLDAVIPGLSATGRFSFDTYGEFNTNRTGVNDLYFAGSRTPDGNLSLEQVRVGNTYLGYGTGSSGERIMYLEGNINYNRTFGSHNFGALGVYNMRNRVIGTAGDVKHAIPYKNQTLAGRVTYGFKDKYLAEVNVGYTGSENFQKGQKFGLFPAASLGWVVSNEDFFAPFTSTFNLLKIRASQGVTGNDQIGGGDRFGYLTYIGGGTGATFGLNPSYSGGIREEVIGTQKLRWEKSTKTNIGLEIGLLNKVNLVVDLFRDRRKDILIRRNAISTIAGVSEQYIYANLGEMVNEGFDGSLEYNDRIGKDFKVRLFGNFTFARNEILYADFPQRLYDYQQPEGHRYGEFTGYVSKGLFVDANDVDNSPSQFRTVYPGDIKYNDLSGDGAVNSNDWTYLGKSSFPKWSYGFGFALQYKGIELSTLFQGVADVGIMANGSSIASDFGSPGVGVVPFAGGGQYTANMIETTMNRWTKENPSQDVAYPRLTIANTSDNNYLNSSWWLKDGSFCRLKQMTLGYTFGGSFLPKTIDNLQIYASGTNLLTFSKFKIWDPELGSNGANYPYSKTITFGIRAGF